MSNDTQDKEVNEVTTTIKELQINLTTPYSQAPLLKTTNTNIISNSSNIPNNNTNTNINTNTNTSNTTIHEKNISSVLQPNQNIQNQIPQNISTNQQQVPLQSSYQVPMTNLSKNQSLQPGEQPQQIIQVPLNQNNDNTNNINQNIITDDTLKLQQSNTLPAPVLDKSVRHKGKCKWFNDKKGYGFIEMLDGSGDVFVHQTQLHCNGWRSLKEGEDLEFYIETQVDKRRKAINVTGPNGNYCIGTPQPQQQFSNNVNTFQRNFHPNNQMQNQQPQPQYSNQYPYPQYNNGYATYNRPPYPQGSYTVPQAPPRYISQPQYGHIYSQPIPTTTTAPPIHNTIYTTTTAPPISAPPTYTYRTSTIPTYTTSAPPTNTSYYYTTNNSYTI